VSQSQTVRSSLIDRNDFGDTWQVIFHINLSLCEISITMCVEQQSWQEIDLPLKKQLPQLVPP